MRDRAARVLRADDEGVVSLETAILAVVLALLIGLAVAGGRITMAGSEVDAAAKAAARQASISRGPDADVSAREAAAESLRRSGVDCTSFGVQLDFTAPGKGARVTATVTCTISLSDVLPGMPGTKTMTSTVISPVDRYRDVSSGSVGPGVFRTVPFGPQEAASV